MSDEQRTVKLQPAWLRLLEAEFTKPYMQELSLFLREQRSAGVPVYPPAREIFTAFWATPPDQVRVVILGQDPYHNPGQAHGLCFSVNRGVAVPPSLLNIYKELYSDLGVTAPRHGFLQSWADQGVLLLNSVLTVAHREAGSHQGKGWETFTDRVIELLNERAEPTVFMLWGSHAQKKGRAVTASHHLVLTAPHPSPLSAHRGFLGCKHFSRANDFLREQGRGAVDWQLPG
ncbi:MAG: uracil-DNA glycosylase [Pseudomonadota bacterium]